MEYNFHQNQKKNWIETETTMRQLEIPKQNYYRPAISVNLIKLIKNQNSNNNMRNR
jgi:hypothetical protein